MRNILLGYIFSFLVPFIGFGQDQSLDEIGKVVVTSLKKKDPDLLKSVFLNREEFDLFVDSMGKYVNLPPVSNDSLYEMMSGSLEKKFFKALGKLSDAGITFKRLKYADVILDQKKDKFGLKNGNIHVIIKDKKEYFQIVFVSSFYVNGYWRVGAEMDYEDIKDKK